MFLLQGGKKQQQKNNLQQEKKCFVTNKTNFLGNSKKII